MLPKWAWSGSREQFLLVDLENFATASHRYIGDIHNSTVVGLFMTHCLRLNLQLRTISLVRTCRISSFCTVVWQLARLLLTRRIARSLGDSWASCKLVFGDTTKHMKHGRSCDIEIWWFSDENYALGLCPRATFSTSGSSFFNVHSLPCIIRIM